MGSLVRLGVLAGIGGILYNLLHKKAAMGKDAGPAPVHSSGVMRDAGPENMQDTEVRKWDKVDEQSDESFPASDPPANY